MSRNVSNGIILTPDIQRMVSNVALFGVIYRISRHRLPWNVAQSQYLLRSLHPLLAVRQCTAGSTRTRARRPRTRTSCQRVNICMRVHHSSPVSTASIDLALLWPSRSTGARTEVMSWDNSVTMNAAFIQVYTIEQALHALLFWAERRLLSSRVLLSCLRPPC